MYKGNSSKSGISTRYQSLRSGKQRSRVGLKSFVIYMCIKEAKATKDERLPGCLGRQEATIQAGGL